MSDAIWSRTPLWVAYVDNPHITSNIEEPVVLLAAGKNIADAVLQCATEADAAGHDDIATQAYRAHARIVGSSYVDGDGREWSFAPEGFFGDLMTFQDGEVTYYVQKIHNLDDSE